MYLDMEWLGYHWDNVKEIREHKKLAKYHNKMYMQGMSPVFSYNLPNDQYIDYKELEIPEYDFIPSYEGMNDTFHLMHVHIPKCGGTTFEQPLDILKHHLMKEGGKEKSIVTGKLSNKHVTKLVEDLEETKTSFYCIHNTEWESLYKNQLVFSIIRNPKDRLLSHIKHKARRCNLEEIHQRIDEKNSDFDNLMHRHLFDFGQRDKIHCIDIDDRNSLINLKSTYLSAAKLPNILQSSRFNDGNDRPDVKISESDVLHAYKKCVDKGYLEKDENIDFNCEKFMSEGNKVHPLTFVVSKDERYGIIPTKVLFQNPPLPQ